MKATLLIVVWLSICMSSSANGLDLEFVRQQYEKAATDKSVCEMMIAQLSKNAGSHIHLAYLGAYQAIWANHAPGVLTKFNTFNKGKKNIEEAVKANADNVEIRMVRLSIQQNCPSFLNYNDNIDQDRQFLEKYKNTVESVFVRRMINELLSK